MLKNCGFVLTIIRDINLLLATQFARTLAARIHRYTYRAVPDPKNVVVVGGSFAGWMLAESLATSLPTGWRVVLIEKNTHFNFIWLWPRMVAVPGHDHKGFVPYPRKPAGAPKGVYLFKQATVSKFVKEQVILDNNEVVDFSCLCIATGSSRRFPSALTPLSKAAGMGFFRSFQNQILSAQRIVLIGGGPVGVEIATDTKSRYPDKDVTIIHSRPRLVNNLGGKLHETGLKACDDMEIRVCFNERPAIPQGTTHGPGALVLKAGETIASVFAAFSLTSIASDGGILVNEFLQVQSSTSSTDSSAFPNIFALGDVASLPSSVTRDVSAPKMGRPASIQGMLVAKNTVRHILGKPLKAYEVNSLDRGLKLTLGLDKHVLYMTDGQSESLFHQKSKVVGVDAEGLPIGDDISAAQMWKMMGQKPFKDDGEGEKDVD